MRAIRFAVMAACFATLLSCERVETDPADFPMDPFLDAQTYQGALNRIAPDEWTVVAFDRTEPSSENPDLAGVVLALSKHNTKEEFLFLYHFLGGRNDAGFSVAGAKGAPQPVVIDAQSPAKFEWKSRVLSLSDPNGFWKTNSEIIGRRYPVHTTLEEIHVEGRFGDYDVRILFNEASQGWEFEVKKFEG